MKWYVIYTKVRQEFRARENLEAQGFEVFLPTCQAQKKAQGKIKLEIEPLFNRYLFIRLSDLTSNWFPIRSTRGVSQVLRFGTSTVPVTLPDAIIDYLKHRCANNKPLYELFKKGQLLEVTQGPFKGLTGFFDELETLPDGLSRAMLLIEVLGSVQRLHFNIQQVKRHGT